jgi:hypothetical protein
MRYLPAAFLALACLASCAAAPKAAARPVVRPPDPVLRLTADGPAVAYAVPEGWRAVPSEEEAGPIILVRPDRKDEAAAIVLEESGLDDKVEAVTAGWAMKAATLLNSFHVTDISQPQYVSDEDASFTVSGIDEDAKRPMLLYCRIRHVGNPTTDYWATVLMTGPAEDAKSLSDTAEQIAKSLQIRAPSPLK